MLGEGAVRQKISAAGRALQYGDARPSGWLDDCGRLLPEWAVVGGRDYPDYRSATGLDLSEARPVVFSLSAYCITSASSR